MLLHVSVNKLSSGSLLPCFAKVISVSLLTQHMTYYGPPNTLTQSHSAPHTAHTPIG